MGSRIVSVGVAAGRAPAASSVALEVRAARACLRRAKVGADDVGLLVNAGVYRDGNIVEPAIASFIQRKLGANVNLNGTPGTFSFDLANGACGPVTGLMLVDGFLESGIMRYGLVVAGDAEPLPGLNVGFEYAPSAAAILLAPGAADEGFLAFRSDATTDGLDLYGGRLVWGAGDRGEHRLVITVSDTYADECLAAAVDSLQALLEETSLTPADVDLLVPSQTPPQLVDGLRAATGLGDKVVDVTGEYGNVHTAGVGMAFERALRDGRVTPGGHVVFLTVGAGIATSLALYKVPR
jgi:3-oxoacyl-[acyl-carrier-protein] synthase-3